MFNELCYGDGSVIDVVLLLDPFLLIKLLLIPTLFYLRLVAYQEEWPRMEKWFNMFNNLVTVEAQSPLGRAVVFILVVICRDACIKIPITFHYFWSSGHCIPSAQWIYCYFS